ncbi:hypothetical protein J3R83DRAFT_11094 [Lanmaoa asiatica]|nr:hypothetical protein J3R83DRAFT_11094 [Lanmaoa asiatica]
MSQIVSGFINFGALHIKTAGFAPWTGEDPGCSEIIGGNLTVSKENQIGVENKHFKKAQRRRMIEALLDPKTWLFALFSALDNVPNSLTNQRQIIISSFGFTYLDTTLLGCVDGFIEIMTIWTGVTLAARIPNGRAYVGALYFVPSLIGVLTIEFLPWRNQVGLLFGIWLVDINITGFIMSLSWVTNVTAWTHKEVDVYGYGDVGHDERDHAQRILHRKCIIIGICYLICPFLLLTIRWVLARENARRDAESTEEDKEFFIEKESENGTRVQVKVAKVWCSLSFPDVDAGG